MKLNRFKTTTCTALAFVVTASLSGAAEIKDVMKSAMKGDTSLHKTVATGKGTQTDADKLLACCSAPCPAVT